MVGQKSESEAKVIPRDWQVKRLRDVSKEIGDGIHATPEYTANSEFFFINGNNLMNGAIRISSSAMSVDEKEYKKYKKPLSKLRPDEGHNTEDIMKAFQAVTEKYIHISAHGNHTADEGTAIYATDDSSNRIINAEDVLKSQLWALNNQKEKAPKLIVMAACHTGRYADMALAFSEAGCPNFIAPPHSPTWIEATLFNTLFYYNLFVLGKSELDAFKETLCQVPNLAHEWNFFLNGVKQ